MKSCYLLVVLAVLCYGDARPQRDLVSNSQHKIVRKQHVPLHVRKQYIDTYGGNSVMSGNPVNQGFGETESQQNYIEDPENGQQANIANTLQGAGISLNSGLAQNDMGESQVGSMSNDLVDSTEGTEGRQMIGNGFMQGGGGGLDISPGGASNLGGSLDGSLGGGLGAGLGGGSIGGGGLGAGLGGGTSLGLGGGTIEMGGGQGMGGGGQGIGGGGQGMGALNDEVGTGGDIGNGAGLGGSIGGAGLGGGSVETIGDGSLGDGGGSLGDSGIGGGSFGDGGNLGGGNLGNSMIEDGSLGGNIGAAGLNGLGDLGGGLGDNFGDVGGLSGGDNQISDSLAGLGGTSGGNIGDGLGLEALGSRIAAGSKAQNLGPLGGAHHPPGFAGLGGNEGLLAGMQSDHQTPLDMQLSGAADENPSLIHTGLTSILPGKTVHAHVSDKPTINRPAISGPSMNAALQVQEQAKKQHQKRLGALKLKLKKLRGRLEALQRDGDKQDKIASSTQHNVNKEEIKTLNELRVATQDAIRELHTDYPHAKKKQETAQPKHESLGSKLKTVDFTAKETGDTLEELLKLLDPELQDKKRGKVNKTNNTRLDDEAENKLALLTKKAEDEVDELASQNPKPKTVPQANATSSENTAKVAQQKLSTSWKGLPVKDSNKDKLKKEFSEMGKTKSTPKPKNLLKYKSLGCWRDDPDRVVPSLENTSTLLKDGYRVRKSSVKKCAQVAKDQGFKGFAVENGGQCFGGHDLLERYKKYGRSRDCANDGRGGDYALNVYTFQ